MSVDAEMVRAILQLVFGIAALLWYPLGIAIRSYRSKNKGVGYWDVDTPLWHKIVIWPVIFVLFILFTWATFF
jgi:hypothetical protein